MNKENKQQNNKPVSAYHTMLERVKAYYDEFEDHLLPDALDHAKQQAQHLGELTAEEAEEIAGFVQRDLEAAGQHLRETGKNLKRWLLFDWELIEDRLWESFSLAADKYQIDKLQLEQRLQRGPIYRSGEVISIGTLQCDNCGELLHFHAISEIPICPKCQHQQYSRVSTTE